MSTTLTCTDTLQKVGYTIIDGVKVVQHVCSIALDDPEKEPRITYTKLNPKMYRANIDVCRADIAEFEDASYQLQKEYFEKVTE